MHAISIEKQVINQMPVVAFPGHIHIIDAVSQVKSAVSALRTMPIVGFDTETRPSFRRGERHQMALLQLSNENDAFLFRINRTGIPTPLKQYLAIIFHQKISKSQQLTNWEAPQLTEAQQRYAAIDAWACLRIYNHLMAGNFIPQESPFWHEVIEQD